MLLSCARPLVGSRTVQMPHFHPVFPPGGPKQGRGPSALLMCSGPKASLPPVGWGRRLRRDWGGRLLRNVGKRAGTLFPGKTVRLGCGVWWEWGHLRTSSAPESSSGVEPCPEWEARGLAQAGSFPKHSTQEPPERTGERAGGGGQLDPSRDLTSGSCLAECCCWFPQTVCFPAKISVSSET